jgi:hypothetical protein
MCCLLFIMLSIIQLNMKKIMMLIVNLSKIFKSQLGLQDSGVVFRSSRSNSSTYYDNQNESIVNNNNTITTNEHTSTNTRNALLMEQTIEQDQLNNGKSKQPQLVSFDYLKFNNKNNFFFSFTFQF